jgi:hypothetical protein
MLPPFLLVVVMGLQALNQHDYLCLLILWTKVLITETFRNGISCLFSKVKHHFGLL